ILMADLRELFESLGFDEVKTYIQSGNVVFSSEGQTDIEKVISAEILSKFGWEVPVLVRTTLEIENVLNECLFPKEKMEDSYFTLLKEPPSKKLIGEVNKVEQANEEFLVTSRCIYFYCALGYRKVKLNNNWFERKLKVSSTTRNYRTLNKLLELASN
ncbi:MAG: DUF1697 domain-containing protein, partial [Flavobacteriaceae bacterium]|nr:DUF1697 domain-containing protein [Flavobacteriaceae bacterium]